MNSSHIVRAAACAALMAAGCDMAATQEPVTTKAEREIVFKTIDLDKDNKLSKSEYVATFKGAEGKQKADVIWSRVARNTSSIDQGKFESSINSFADPCRQLNPPDYCKYLKSIQAAQ